MGDGVHTVCDIDPEEPANMSVLLAFDRSHAVSQRLCLNDVARQNIKSILTTLDTAHFETSPLNDAAPLNILDISFALETSQFEMSPLKDVATRNIADISFALDTSHFERSPLNNLAKAKVRLMAVSFDTSHSPIADVDEHSPLGDSLRHAAIAFLSSTSDCGENAAVGWGGESVRLSEITGEAQKRMNDGVYEL